ncbi:excalibur calcium-binding domain-containing protein [Nakamurella sp. GG22]
MGYWKRLFAGALTVLLAFVLIAPAASADSVTGIGTLNGKAYRGGVAANGGVSYAVGIQVYKDGSGRITKVRGAARITKLSKALRVQVTSVAVGTSTTALARNATPANSGTASTVISYTPWVSVAAGSCRDYRARGIYSVRWTDGGLSNLNILSPLTRVCGSSTVPPRPADRDCDDFATQAQAQAFFDKYFPYYGDVARLDADNDRIACEALP